MSEVVDGIYWGRTEGQFARNEPHAGYTVPQADKVDIDVCAESFLELGTHLPALWGIIFIEVVREIDLRSITRRQETNLV